MRVAIFIPSGLNNYHFETELELAQRHLDDGDDVDVIVCGGSLPSCDFNPKHDVGLCHRCCARRERGLELLSRRVAVHYLPLSDVPSTAPGWSVPAIRTLDELSAVRVDDFELGNAVLSSLVSLRREPQPNVTRERSLISRLLISGHATFRAMQHHLQKTKPSRLYVFNGRFVLSRAALSAAESRGTDYFTHERGSSIDRFSLYKNTLPHDPAALASRIVSSWAEAGEDREAVGSRFYEERAAGIIHNWRPFTAHQVPGALPEGFVPGKRNVVIFVSSEDEFVALGPKWRHHIYSGQVDGVRRILETFAAQPSFHFTLRVHPNLRGVDNSQTREMAALKAPNLTTVPADSAVSSYALLSAAEKVLTFGSTVGIEAVYWDKPSIVAGPAPYRHLAGPRFPTSHAEVTALLRADLPPANKEGALQYGYYSLTFGEPFLHFHPTSLSGGRFRGSSIEISRLEKALLQQLSGRLATPIRIGARAVSRAVALRRLGHSPWL